MLEESESHFTVTLGRSGRVVKRSGRVSDDEFSGSGAVSGSKRSVKDRLGTRVDDSLEDRSHNRHKRRRGERTEESPHRDVSNDTHLGKGDLRFKLKQKNVSRQFQNKDPPTYTDLRDKLSRKATLPPADRKRNFPSDATLGTRKSMLETRDIYDDGWRNMVERRTYDGERQSMREIRDSAGRQSMREPGDTYSAERRSMPKPRDTYSAERRYMPEPTDTYSVERRSMREHRVTYSHARPSTLENVDGYDRRRQGILGPVPARIGSDLPAVGHARTSYPSRTSDNLRCRSPDRILCSSMSKTLSPERNVEELQRRALIRPYDDGKSNAYRRNEVLSPQRAVGSGNLMKQPGLNALPPASAKPAPVTAQYHQASRVVPRIPNPGAQPSVDGFLQSLGLEKFVILFKAEEVDFHALRQMSDIDLKELGIPMGPRKKILQALLPRPSGQLRGSRRS